jgi:hypothetical protein
MKPRTLGAASVGTKSSGKDEVDPLWKKDDPIGLTQQKREGEGGSKLGIVKNPNSYTGKFYFTIKLKGDGCVPRESDSM